MQEHGGNILNITKNPDCLRCRNKEERIANEDDSFCLRVKSTEDKLPLRCVGEWGKDKVTFVSKYVSLVGVAMKNQKWQTNYIEICSGPGRCIDYRSGNEFDGSPLAVLKSEGAEYYSRLVFIDYDDNVIDTLKKRIALSSCINNKVKSKTLVYRGDYTKANGICSTIEKAINSNSLNVIFIDPTDLSVPFSLYKELSKRLQKVDFVLNIATGTDLNRNIVKAFDERELPIRKKYEKALGSNLFFEDEKNRRLAQKNQSTLLTDAFLERLLLSFYEIGYPMHVEKRIRNYYQLIYLSQKSLGKKLWEVAVKRNASEADSRQGLLNLSGGNNG